MDIVNQLKENATKNVERIKELQQENIRANAAFEDLKKKTYLTIKHLVEDVIEKQEVEIEKLKREIEELKTPKKASLAKDAFIRAVQVAVKNSPQI